MNISPLLGVHAFVDGKITLRNKQYQLQIAPLKATKERQPNYQLIYKDQSSPFHDQRVSGLWSDDGVVYRGSVFHRGNQKHYFVISCSDSTCKIEKWKKG